MVARRLVIVMLVMLGISSLAALLAPTGSRDESTTETTTTRERSAQGDEPGGRLVHAKIDASRRQPTVIRIRAGDQLVLIVRTKDPDGVEISRLGELEDVDPLSAARFDLLPEPGRYPIRLVSSRRVIGEIVVGASGSRRRG